MEQFIALILDSGKSAVDLILYILLPVMVVMMALMRLLESRGVLAFTAKFLSPILGRFGVPGVGVFAVLQVLLVSFAAPTSTLALMERNRIKRQSLAATLAMVLTMSQANAVFPMVTVGLNIWVILGTSLLGGVIAASLTYYWFARSLRALDENEKKLPKETKEEIADKDESAEYQITAYTLKVMALEGLSPEQVEGLEKIKGRKVKGTFAFLELLEKDLINVDYSGRKLLILKHAQRGFLDQLLRGGREGLKISLDSIPILVLAIFVVKILQSVGFIPLLEWGLAPVLNMIDLPGLVVLPIVTKYLAGGTAMLGVSLDLIREGALTASELNRSAGFFINPMDFVGIAVLRSAGPRVASVIKPAMKGALLGILVRGFIHLLIF